MLRNLTPLSDPLLRDEKKSEGYSINISTDVKITQRLEMESKLNLCIAILECQIKKKECVKTTPYVITALSMLTASVHQIASACIFNSSLNHLCSESLMSSFSKGVSCLQTWGAKMSHLNECDGGYPGVNSISFSCKHAISTLLEWQSLTAVDPPCNDAVNDLLSGSGMWNGYLPTIITLGIGIPGLICCIRSISPCRLLLPSGKMDTIRNYAQLYNVQCNRWSDLDHILECFEKRLNRSKKESKELDYETAYTLGATEGVLNAALTTQPT